VPTLFVLLPATGDLGALPAEACRIRHYPAASDERHLLGLVRAGRDRAATTWRRGAALAVGGGAIVGTIVNGVLASWFDMFAGMLGIALPLGLVLGAFLGGFTAAMTGTETARPEVRALGKHANPGDRLVQITTDDAAIAAALRERCRELGWHAVTIA